MRWKLPGEMFTPGWMDPPGQTDALVDPAPPTFPGSLPTPHPEPWPQFQNPIPEPQILDLCLSGIRILVPPGAWGHRCPCPLPLIITIIININDQNYFDHRERGGPWVSPDVPGYPCPLPQPGILYIKREEFPSFPLFAPRGWLVSLPSASVPSRCHRVSTSGWGWGVTLGDNVPSSRRWRRAWPGARMGIKDLVEKAATPGICHPRDGDTAVTPLSPPPARSIPNAGIPGMLQARPQPRVPSPLPPRPPPVPSSCDVTSCHLPPPPRAGMSAGGAGINCVNQERLMRRWRCQRGGVAQLAPARGWRHGAGTSRDPRGDSW